MARISDGAERLGIDLTDAPLNVGAFRVKDIFTTKDGSWEPGGRSDYSIPGWAREAYLLPYGHPEYFDDAGADHHILVRVEDEDGDIVQTGVAYNTDDGFAEAHDTGKKDSGWVNLPIYNSANPGDYSPWTHGPSGSGVFVRGGALPHNQHVSLFVVWTYDPDAVDPDPPDPSDGDEVTVHINRPTTVVFKNPEQHPVRVLLNGATIWNK